MRQKAEAINKKSDVKRENSASHIRKINSSSLTNSPADRIMFLQRTVGNQAVQRLIKSGTLQAKLRIGQPGDKYEQEADRVADEVMRMPEQGVQRQVEPEEEEEEMLQTKPLVNQITPLVQVQRQEEEMLQVMSREDATPEVSNDLESQINAIKGGGRPLAKSERAYFDPRFGADFSQVRVHSDAQAVESTQVLNARAYTLGQDVVFGAGQYAPGTSEGRRLMAHELTHVVQQNGGRTVIQRKPPLKDVLKDYQVKEDEVKKWSPKLWGWIPIPGAPSRDLTEIEGKLLDKLTLMDLRSFNDIKERAFSVSKEKYPSPSTIPGHVPKDRKQQWLNVDGHRDAFRHAFWNALLTKHFGIKWTKQFATAHEALPGNPAQSEAMDLYNNEVGRQIAAANIKASKTDLAELIEKAVTSGETVVVNSAGDLAWSDTVALWDHGLASTNTREGKIEVPKGDAYVYRY